MRGFVRTLGQKQRGFVDWVCNCGFEVRLSHRAPPSSESLTVLPELAMPRPPFVGPGPVEGVVVVAVAASLIDRLKRDRYPLEFAGDLSLTVLR